MDAKTINLRDAALGLLAQAWPNIDAGARLRQALRLAGERLLVFDSAVNLAELSEIYAVALGKAALPMALALSEILPNLTGGVISAPLTESSLPSVWRVFAGGHPLPNADSLAAGRAAAGLLRRANHERALVIFLISGGGSAMLERLRDKRLTLADLRAANRVLVGCGAPIADVNAIRRCLSSSKGGGLSAIAPRAAQISLLVSDTNRGDEANIASGPTLRPVEKRDVAAIIERYGLRELLPPAVTRALEQAAADEPHEIPPSRRAVHLLLDNQSAVEAVAETAAARGFLVETATDLVETPIAEGCRELMARLFALRQRAAAQGKIACLVSGGEFVCPARGTGSGGRNLEAALRCALASETHKAGQFVALHAGTDGVDGNSPAAGALADETTLARAQALRLDARAFLANSDAYNFFAALGDTIMTGPTGTNVRDIRILLANESGF